MRPDYFFTLDFTLGAYLFHLRGSHPRHLRLRRTSFDLDMCSDSKSLMGNSR
jgi:hypothetical protein